MGYKFIGESAGDNSGQVVSSAGDVDGDGKDDLFISAPLSDIGGAWSGTTYLINANDLAALDAADGITDGLINLGNVAGTGASYAFVGEDGLDISGVSLDGTGDVDGDGKSDLLIGARSADVGAGNTYLINAADLAALDLADGVADGEIDLGHVAATGSSVKFVGQNPVDQSAVEVSFAGDVDGDGKDDILIGADQTGTGTNGTGEAYLINADGLGALDAEDGLTDGTIDLGVVGTTTPSGGISVEEEPILGDSYIFVGENLDDRAGYSVSSAGDVDGDGKDDILIGARNSDAGGEDSGSVYLVNAADLATLDAADGAVDGSIDLSDVAATGTSYQFTGEDPSDQASLDINFAGDIDDDGKGDILISAIGGSPESAFLINAADLASLDLADGVADGLIDLGNVAGTGSSYQFVGETSTDNIGISVDSAGDVDGDGNDDILIGAYRAQDSGGNHIGRSYLVNSNDLAALDAADGIVDGVINAGNIAATGTSYEFEGEDDGDSFGYSVSSAGDVDGDGKDDLLISAYLADDGPTGDSHGSSYLVLGSELAALDAVDGSVDGVIQAANVQCFLTGTLIATPDGETPVEALQIGDSLRTADGRSVPVKWVARQTIATRFYRERAEPVRIRAGALGAGLPHSDLTVTADHGMIISRSNSEASGETNGGLVVNASALVNGTTIHFVPHRELPEHFTVYHIETQAHDVILANGAASETYLDIPDRQGFDNYQEYLDLYGAEMTITEIKMPRISSSRLLPEHIRSALGIDTNRVVLCQ